MLSSTSDAGRPRTPSWPALQPSTAAAQVRLAEPRTSHTLTPEHAELAPEAVDLPAGMHCCVRAADEKAQTPDAGHAAVPGGDRLRAPATRPASSPGTLTAPVRRWSLWSLLVGYTLDPNAAQVRSAACAAAAPSCRLSAAALAGRMRWSGACACAGPAPAAVLAERFSVAST